MKNLTSVPVLSMEESNKLCNRLLDAGVFIVSDLIETGVRITSIRKVALARAQLRRRSGFNRSLDADDTTDIVMPGLTPGLRDVIAGLNRWE